MIYIPPYKEWPDAHKKLLYFMLASLLCILLFVWFFALPYWNSYQKAKLQYDKQIKELESSRWPSNSITLKNHLNYCTALLNGTDDTPGLIEISDFILQNATDNFFDDILKAFPQTELTVSEENHEALLEILYSNASRLEYKDICDRIESEFKDFNLHLNPAAFELKEEADSPIYQMIIRAWTIQTLLRLAVAQGLRPVCQDGFACISPLPAIYFSVKETDQQPYLIEFPIRLSLQGKLPDFLEFLKTLQTAESFYPVKQLEIISFPPSDLPKTTTLDTVQLNLVCSSFLDCPQLAAEEDGPHPSQEEEEKE